MLKSGFARLAHINIRNDTMIPDTHNLPYLADCALSIFMNKKMLT